MHCYSYFGFVDHIKDTYGHNTQEMFIYTKLEKFRYSNDDISATKVAQPGPEGSPNLVWHSGIELRRQIRPFTNSGLMAEGSHLVRGLPC